MYVFVSTLAYGGRTATASGDSQASFYETGSLIGLKLLKQAELGGWGAIGIHQSLCLGLLTLALMPEFSRMWVLGIPHRTSFLQDKSFTN